MKKLTKAQANTAYLYAMYDKQLSHSVRDSKEWIRNVYMKVSLADELGIEVCSWERKIYEQELNKMLEGAA